MVTTTDTTNIVTTPKILEQNHRSIKRFLKHFLYMPASKRFFSKQDQHAIATAVEQAEHGHIGEIQVVIEACLPARLAYTYTTRARAEQLFAELGVWDTEYNSGVLLYLNLCEHKVEIIIDRGIKNATSQDEWDSICCSIVLCLKDGQYREGVIVGVEKIGKLLDVYYDRKIIDIENELGNSPITLG
jgi:uncharacterized membrane protein